MDEELSRRLGGIEEKLDKVRTEDIPGIRIEVAREVAALKVKSGVWGLAAGLLSSLAVLLFGLLRK